MHPSRPEGTCRLVGAATSQGSWSFQGSLATEVLLSHFGTILLPELGDNSPVPAVGRQEVPVGGDSECVVSPGASFSHRL